METIGRVYYGMGNGEQEERPVSEGLDDTSPPQATVRIHYIKGPTYREVVCDGVIGGPTPQRKGIWLSLYAERAPIPRVTVHAAIKEGDAFKIEEGKSPLQTESRDGVIRTIEVTTYLDVDVAVRLREWLDRHIKSLRPDQ